MYKFVLFVSVVVVIASYNMGLETLYLASQEGMIDDGDFVFILFELDQLNVDRKAKLPYRWFDNFYLRKYRSVVMIVLKPVAFKEQP